jgi:hypothetical protein
MTARRLPVFATAAALVLVIGLAHPAAHAGQDDGTYDGAGTTSSTSRTEASQIEMPGADADTARQDRAFLDPAGQPVAPAPTRGSLTETTQSQISRGESSAPASQISARGQGGSAVAQLSKADLEATLAQLSAAERRVLLQAIEGTDICNAPPNVAAIVALCQNRIENRSAEFTATSAGGASAEDRLLRGDLDNTALPSVDQVIERLARGNASSADFSNQAIASIALGTSPATTAPPREEQQPDTASFGEETQALINALITQLGGRAP